MTKAKFKVLELDWYCSFHKYASFFAPDTSEEDAYQWCKEEYENEKKEVGIHLADGPFRYLEECEDPGFPPRNGVKYCVRTNKKCIQRHYKPYECYCYQVGRWWKYKNDEHLFTNIYIPQIMSHYEYERYKAPLKFLSKNAYNDWIFHQRNQELRVIRRNASKSVHSILGR